MEGYAKGVKGIMTAYKSGRFGNAKIYGPLAQLIKTDKKYITAIETALGAASQNIVTETENEAKQAIAYLKEKHLGRADILRFIHKDKEFRPLFRCAVRGIYFNGGTACRMR